MICRFFTRFKLVFAFVLLALPAVTKGQQVAGDSSAAKRWQNWLSQQKSLPIGAWAFGNALDDESLRLRYTSAGFNLLPKSQWSKNSTAPDGLSAALDLATLGETSAANIGQLIKSGPAPTLVILGQELIPDQFLAAGKLADAVNTATGGTALPLNSVLPNWYCYFDRLNITYEQYIEQFIAQAKPEVLMAVELPLMADGTDRVFYYDELDVLRRESMDHGIGLFGLIQAVGHGPRFRQPSASDLRWQVYTYLAFGAKGLWYYYFVGDGRTDGLTTGLAWYPKQLGPADAPRGFGARQTPASKQTLETIRQINSEVTNLSPTLLKLRSAGLFYTGPELPPALNSTRDEPASPFAQISGDDLLVGVFHGGDNSSTDSCAMIVNTRHGPDAEAASLEKTLSFTLKPPFSSVDLIDPATGNTRRLTAGPPGYTMHLSGGQGMLIRCH